MAYNAAKTLQQSQQGITNPVSAGQMDLAQLLSGYYRPAAEGQKAVGPDFNQLTKGQFDSLDPETQKALREKYPQAGQGSVMGSLSDAADLGLGGSGFRHGMSLYKSLSGAGAAGSAAGASVGWKSL